MHKAIILLAAVLCGCSQPLPRDDIAPAHPGEVRAVVFDIDGTLTPRVHTVNQARADAAEAINLFADKGYQIVYLSARARGLSAGIPAWLSNNGFPEGSTHVAQTVRDRIRPAAFKQAVLQECIDQGWRIEYAYGDSSTDFEAYAAVGIPRDRVYALRREGERSCQPGAWNTCLGGWTEHLGFVSHSVPPAGTH